MVTVLAIETSTTVCAAAVVRDTTTIAEAMLEERSVHAEKIMSLIDQVLAVSGSVDAVAVSAGPGSFTGLRIGLSAAKGLSFAWNIPLLAVPTLDALADHAVASGVRKSDESILALIDARRDEVYGQIFDMKGDILVGRDAPRDVAITMIPDWVGEGRVLVVGDGSEKCASMLQSATDSVRKRFRFPGDRRLVCSASAVGRIGVRLHAAGTLADPVTLEPMYIKEFFLTTR